MAAGERKTSLPALNPRASILIQDDEATPRTMAAYSAAYTQALTPHATIPIVQDGSIEPPKALRVNRIVYTSAYLSMLQGVLYGWSLSQLNYSKFNNIEDCDRRPITPGTCLMFPGHTSTEWIFVVNSWVVGGIFGGLLCGPVADQIGRKRTLMLNCAIIATGAVVQAVSPTLLVFCVGRFITGIACGVVAAVCNTYVSEISPPHIRGVLGSFYSVAIGSGVFLVGLMPFVAGTSTGWRYIAAFPIIVAIVFAQLAPKHLAESPTWLVTRGHHDEARKVLAQFYGEENVDVALSWIKAPVEEPRLDESSSSTSEAASPVHLSYVQPQRQQQQIAPAKPSPLKSLMTKQHRKKLILAVALAFATQFSGINAVFFYSSSILKDAGIEDSRIGSLIVNLFNLIPAMVAGRYVKRIGNRRGIILGPCGMILSALGLTIARVYHISSLSILFITTYVVTFTVCLGAMGVAVGTSLFPDSLRATGTSIMMCINWCGTFTIGVGYPFLAACLNAYAFVPFIGTLSFFALFFYVFLPDTTNKTTAEIQELFEPGHLKKEQASAV
ncbi:hypothetical protein Poli38472_007854 [Pythium oligandrum]|uniref:Hexose transporter 1 n=1 Tax=Pythium oligandrum TaxID=41045 RepID=A0A8K1CQY5_PYTOL|nr:hypothetical protein Poli38472_007854 [Pythium oligandrum]|eukprot:TMW68182.1 hypothetical protein Poli38472_007854 [Pythium oligandrum]